MQQTINNYYPEDLDETININTKKIFIMLWSKKGLMLTTFFCILALFIILTFVLPKKYEIDADLYINKTNNSNISEVNPFVIDEVGGSMLSMGTDKAISNELELMQSPLVIDKVIRENNLRYKKLFGIITTRKTGEYISTEKFLKKNINFENKKNTNVITITYKSKNPKQTYNVVSSIIKNYIELHKEINSLKSKSDKKIIEQEYNRVKAELNKKVNSAGGLPSTAVAGTGNLAAMSSFSSVAQRAMGNLKGQYVAGEKSRVEISENAAKVGALSQKLEWAKLVEDMSDTSKVLVIKEPVLLRDFENSSPKLFTNIMLGIIFGIFGSLISAIISEINSKKLTYSQLDNDVIYDIKKEFIDLKILLLANSTKPVSFVLFESIPQDIAEKLKEFRNIKYVNADITSEFLFGIRDVSDVIMVGKINTTDANIYKQVKRILKETHKNIIKEVLV